MPHVRLQPIQRQDHLLLSLEPLLEPLGIRQMQRQQFFIAIELIGDRALCHHHSSLQEFLVDLRDTALLSVAQHSHQRNHIQPEFSMWQGPCPFFLRTRGLVVAGTLPIAAAIHFEGQTRDPL